MEMKRKPDTLSEQELEDTKKEMQTLVDEMWDYVKSDRKFQTEVNYEECLEFATQLYLN